MEPVHEEHYKGHTIKIHRDDCAESPRTMWDNLGTMVCCHDRYNLGDRFDIRNMEDAIIEHACELDPTVADRIDYWENSPYIDDEDFQKRKQAIIVKAFEKAVVIDLYLYDHGGITMSCGSFSCPWDSGDIGFIYMSLEDIRKEYGVKKVSKKLREKVDKMLRAEVKTYDRFLVGSVYGYEIVPEYANGCDDSCWGFYCDYDGYVLEEAKSVIDHHIENNAPKDFVNEDGKIAITMPDDESGLDRVVYFTEEEARVVYNRLNEALRKTTEDFNKVSAFNYLAQCLSAGTAAKIRDMFLSAKIKTIEVELKAMMEYCSVSLVDLATRVNMQVWADGKEVVMLDDEPAIIFHSPRTVSDEIVVDFDREYLKKWVNPPNCEEQLNEESDSSKDHK